MEKNAEIRTRVIPETKKKSKMERKRYLDMTSDEFWKYWGRTSPPDNQSKEPILNLPAPVAKKSGGSKSVRRKKKPPKLSINPYL